MIKISSIDKNYYRCSSCLGENELKNISYGINENQTSSLRLCKKCIKEFIKLIETEEQSK